RQHRHHDPRGHTSKKPHRRRLLITRRTRRCSAARRSSCIAHPHRIPDRPANASWPHLPHSNNITHHHQISCSSSEDSTSTSSPVLSFTPSTSSPEVRPRSRPAPPPHAP